MIRFLSNIEWQPFILGKDDKHAGTLLNP